MRVTSIQLEMSDQPKEKNVEHALSLIDRAPPSDLILLPEIWPCGFFSFDRYQRDSEAIDGSDVFDLLVHLGEKIGIMDWRPKFGRFQVTNLD